MIIALEALHHVSTLASPLIDFPVCLHCIHQVRATVLDCNRVAMIMKPADQLESQSATSQAKVNEALTSV